MPEKKVVKKSSQELNLGKGVRVTLEMGVSIAIPQEDSRYSNFFVCKPAISLDCGPTKERMEQALETASEIIDNFLEPKINFQLKKIAKRRRN